jgi:hypothetical protein
MTFTTTGPFLRTTDFGIPVVFEGTCTEGALASDPCTASTTVVFERALTADDALTTTVTGSMQVTVSVPAESNGTGPLPWAIEVFEAAP